MTRTAHTSNIGANIDERQQQCSARQQRMKICSKKQQCLPEYAHCFVKKWRNGDAEQNENDVHAQPHPVCFFPSSSCAYYHFRHLPPNFFIRFSILFLFAVGYPGNVSATARSRRTLVPLGMDKQMFPPQIFDENAPICTAEREPCGFYSFSLDGKAPLKWIKSWCRCSAQYECVYERTDMRMRVYRQTCVAHDDLLPADDAAGEEEAAEISAAQRQQQSVVLVETVPSSTSADRGAPDALADDDDDHPQRTHRHHHHHHHSNRHHHRHNVVSAAGVTNASRHSRKAHRQRQVIRRLRELVMAD